MISSENLYRLTKDDIDKASLMLNSAFIDYPTFKYLLPKINERKNKLRYVMTFLLKCGLIHGEVLAPSKNIEGVSVWYKSSKLKFGFNSLLKAGLIRTVYHLNINSFIRFKRLGDTKRLQRNNVLSDDYYFLDIIGVDPSFVKQGYARFLIETMLTRIDKEKMIVYLETSNNKNIEYYRKFGFNVVSTYKHDKLEYFCMIRKQVQ